MATRTRPYTPEELAAKAANRATLETVGRRMQDRRKEKRWSQQQVTLRLHEAGLYIQRTSYAHYETGAVEMDMTALIAVARALETTIGYLTGEGETTLPPDMTNDANNEWLHQLRRVSQRVPQGRTRVLFQQHVLDLAEAEAAFVKLVDPSQHGSQTQEDV